MLLVYRTLHKKHISLRNQWKSNILLCFLFKPCFGNLASCPVLLGIQSPSQRIAQRSIPSFVITSTSAEYLKQAKSQLYQIHCLNYSFPSPTAQLLSPLHSSQTASSTMLLSASRGATENTRKTDSLFSFLVSVPTQSQSSSVLQLQGKSDFSLLFQSRSILIRICSFT